MSADHLSWLPVNGHIESTYSVSTGQWTPLQFITDPYKRMHGLSPALNYGQQALEGFKAFRTLDGGIALFRPDRNALRLQHSAETLSMPLVPVDLFIQACRTAVARNAEYVPPFGRGALYVRPLLYGSKGILPPLPATEYTFCVFVAPALGGVHDGTKAVRALILDVFDRAAPRGVGHAKVGGNYAPALRWSEKARAEGFGITLHLDSLRHEEVDEFSTCGFLGVRQGADSAPATTIVVPDSPCAIDSVTSATVQDIASKVLGWKVERRKVLYTELPQFSEVMGAGTGVALLPIRSITRHHNHFSPGTEEGAEQETTEYIPPGEENPGPVYSQLLSQLRAFQLGKVPDEFGWRFEVRADDRQLPDGVAGGNQAGEQ